MIKTMQKSLSALVLMVLAGAAYAVPAELSGRKIQFSYPTSWKFTPLLIHFGEAEPGKPDTYTVGGEGPGCDVVYTPDVAAGKAQLCVRGKGDKASICMSFVTEMSGTAHMKWNGVDYYNLTFRVEDDAGCQDYLCRMGDPVGDVMPPTLAGKVLEVDFSGAFGGEFNPETLKVDYREWRSAPWVLKFPASGQRATAELTGENTVVSATYEPMGCGAMISLNGGDTTGEITLDFAESDSGMARVAWQTGDTSWVVCAARFIILSAGETAEKSAEDTLQKLISSLEQTEYATAVERLYQRRLLELLPQIAQGASVDTVLPGANGTTALHNACGLSHVEIVQWLVEYGASLNAKTAKGASVDACIGGPNTKAIRAILKKNVTPGKQ